MTNILTRARQLEEVAERIGEAHLSRLCGGIRERFAAGNTLVVVCGEFNRGKSSLLNALLGSTLPTDILPTTAILHILCRSDSGSVEVVWRNRATTAIGAAELDAFRAGGRDTDEVRFIRIGVVGSELLDGGAVFVDTPGVNDLNAQRVEVTYEFLPQADVALFLLDAAQAVTRSEAEFLAERLWQIPGQTVIFVLNKIDQLDEDERVESIEASRARLRTVTGRDLTVLPVSARTGEGLAELRAEIFRSVAAARGQAEQLLQGRLVDIGSSLKASIERRSSLLGQTAAELDARRSSLNEAEGAARKRKDAFLRYVEAFGRESLVPMVRQSLRFARESVEEDLLEMLARIPDPGAFLSRDVPSAVHRRLRAWAEQKQPEVNAYLRQFGGKVAQEFHRAFEVPLDAAVLSAPVILARDRQAISLTETPAAGQREFVVGMAMRVASAGALMLLFGPIGAMVGTGIGELGSRALSAKQLGERRAEVGAVLAGTVGALFEKYERALVGGLEGFFSSMEDAIQQHLEEVLAQARQAITGALREVNRSDADRVRELARLRQAADEVDLIVVLAH